VARPRPAWTPPARDGVSASRVAVQPGPWQDAAGFLAWRLPRGGDWPARLARGEVLTAVGTPLEVRAPLRPGEVLWYWRSQPDETPLPLPLPVLHQDAWLVAVDKPHFLPVLPRGRHLQHTALVRLKRTLALETLAPMHRLDLETAGVLVFTVQPATRGAYQALLRERQVHKVYEAVAPWRAAWAQGEHLLRHRLAERGGEAFMQMALTDDPAVPEAQTLLTLQRRLGPWPAGWPVPPGVDAAGGVALYRLQPLTGRKHQLRAQMAACGAPLLGDRIYPVLQRAAAPGAPPDLRHPLQLLARELAFVDPLTGQARRFVSAQRLALDAG
jgi:tRNA pseudouridine32 synthase / 23S rRNA pseudouridine746 synthase